MANNHVDCFFCHDIDCFQCNSHTIWVSSSLHGRTGITGTHSILPPHPHIVRGKRSKSCQGCAQDSTSDWLHREVRSKFWGVPVLHYIASDRAAPIISACSPLDSYGGRRCYHDNPNGRCRGGDYMCVCICIFVNTSVLLHVTTTFTECKHWNTVVSF